MSEESFHWQRMRTLNVAKKAVKEAHKLSWSRILSSTNSKLRHCSYFISRNQIEGECWNLHVYILSHYIYQVAVIFSLDRKTGGRNIGIVL